MSNTIRTLEEIQKIDLDVLAIEAIGKDEKRITSIKNTKELNAVTKEMNAANKSKRQNEQEKANYASKLEEKRSALGALEDAIKARRARLEELAAELESRRPVWKQSVDEKARLRDSIKAGLRPDVFRKYENIRAKRGGVGLALIKDETCQGCHINIPPQVYIELRKGSEEIYTCPHCHRILYVENQDQPETV
ncbi:MAG: hypothetical protein HZB22_00980 [Deltaproteobacteria bacterium]|nr:hypothetical protein [Deltaproteobacteria bacterium]